MPASATRRPMPRLPPITTIFLPLNETIAISLRSLGFTRLAMFRNHGPGSASNDSQVIRISGLHAGPLGNGASTRPLWFPGGGAALGSRDGALLRPASRRVLPWLLPPVDGQVKQVIVVIHHLDTACSRPVSFKYLRPLSQVTDDVHPANLATNQEGLRSEERRVGRER